MAAIRTLAARAAELTERQHADDTEQTRPVLNELTTVTNWLNNTAGRPAPPPATSANNTHAWNEATEAFNDTFDDLDRVEQAIGELIEDPASDLDELLQLRGKFLAGISILRHVADAIKAEPH